MSLSIDIEKVRAILLNDGWYSIVKGSLFFDSYEYISRDGKEVFSEFGGGQSGICSTGFECEVLGEIEGKHRMMGPMTSLLAVKY